MTKITDHYNFRHQFNDLLLFYSLKQVHMITFENVQIILRVKSRCTSKIMLYHAQVHVLPLDQ